MGIQCKGPGQYQAQIRKTGYKSRFATFPSELEAKVWYAQILLQMENGTYIEPGSIKVNPTLGEALDRYMRDITPQKKGAPQEINRIKALQRSSLGSIKLEELTPATLSAYRDFRLKTVAASTFIKELALISNLFNVAIVDWALDLQNPVVKVRKPKVRNSRDRTLSPVEKKYLLDSCARSESKSLHSLVMLALETAMRKGEIVSLDWTNIDLVDRTAFLPDSKNETGRYVPLSSNAIQALKSQGPKTKGSVLEFSRSDSSNGAWSRAVKSAREIYRMDCLTSGAEPHRGFLMDFTFHDLRHTAITMLATKIPNHLELAAMTGHKNLKMLQRYYHPSAAETAKKLI